jgi:hypothetical protein
MMVFSIRRLRPPAPKSDQAPAAPEPGGDDEDAGSQADREPS